MKIEIHYKNKNNAEYVINEVSHIQEYYEDDFCFVQFVYDKSKKTNEYAYACEKKLISHIKIV